MGSATRHHRSFRNGLASLAVLLTSVIVGVPSTADGTITTGSLIPVQPCRLVDTRLADDPTPTADTILVEPAGRCGLPEELTAVAVQVTVTQTLHGGYVAAVPAGSPPTGTSTVNWYRSNQTVTAATIVAVGSGRAIELHRSTATHVVVDVNAYFSAATEARAGRFVGHGPSRVLDTRHLGETAWAAGETRLVPLPPDIPTDAVALVVNVTAAVAPGGGHFTAHLPGTERPLASMLNTDAADQTRASTTIVPVGPEGFVLYSSVGGHVVIDVTGWFTGPSADVGSAGLFRPLGPVRVADTRPQATMLFDGGSQLVDTAAATGAVAGVVGTVTLTQTSASTYLTVFPADTRLPETSTINASGPGESVANMLLLPVSPRGLAMRTHRATHAIVDVTGVFLGEPVTPTPDPYPIGNVDPGPSCHGTTARTAFVDRVAQRMWLCERGRAVTDEMPFTAGPINDAPKGEYRVFFKRDPWWGAGYTLRWFTAFTRGDRGGRVAFHRYVAMRESDVGSERARNTSHGCFRLRAADALTVWSFLSWGDRVVVLNNG